jgi:hypothetical protein
MVSVLSGNDESPMTKQKRHAKGRNDKKDSFLDILIDEVATIATTSQACYLSQFKSSNQKSMEEILRSCHIGDKVEILFKSTEQLELLSNQK